MPEKNLNKKYKNEIDNSLKKLNILKKTKNYFSNDKNYFTNNWSYYFYNTVRQDLGFMNVDIFQYHTNKNKEYFRFIEYKRLNEDIHNERIGQKLILESICNLTRDDIDNVSFEVIKIRSEYPFNYSIIENLKSGKKKIINKIELGEFLTFNKSFDDLKCCKIHENEARYKIEEDFYNWKKSNNNKEYRNNDKDLAYFQCNLSKYINELNKKMVSIGISGIEQKFFIENNKQICKLRIFNQKTWDSNFNVETENAIRRLAVVMDLFSRKNTFNINVESFILTTDIPYTYNCIEEIISGNIKIVNENDMLDFYNYLKFNFSEFNNSNLSYDFVKSESNKLYMDLIVNRDKNKYLNVLKSVLKK